MRTSVEFYLIIVKPHSVIDRNFVAFVYGRFPSHAVYFNLAATLRLAANLAFDVGSKDKAVQC